MDQEISWRYLLLYCWLLVCLCVFGSRTRLNIQRREHRYLPSMSWNVRYINDLCMPREIKQRRQPCAKIEMFQHIDTKVCHVDAIHTRTHTHVWTIGALSELCGL